MQLSLIVPIYKKETVAFQSVAAILDVLDRLFTDYEVIAVIDGSPDRSLLEVQRIVHAKLKILPLPENLGKGGAVRAGMQIAQGNYIGIMDCGLDINPATLHSYAKFILGGYYPIITASKYHPESLYHTGWKRRVFSMVFSFLRKVLFGLDISDTQTGLKFYRASAVKAVLPHLRENRWLWDIEMYVWLKKLSVKPILELPVIINMTSKIDGSESSKFTTIMSILLSLFKLSYRIGYLGKLTNSQTHINMRSVAANLAAKLSL